MAGNRGYEIGRSLARHPKWALLALVAAVAASFFGSCSEPDPKPPIANASSNPTQTAAAPQPAKPPPNAAKDECAAQIANLTTKHAELMKAKEYWEASLAVRRCANLLPDEGLKKLVREAEIASHLQTINDRKSPAIDRARAMQMLARDYPDVGAKYSAQAEGLIAAAEKQEKEAERRQRRKEGVTLGMTEEEVLASSWGRPERVNRTTTSRGTREQWVYGIGNYLYFENGILTAIQN
jgi:hypothetical protein